MKKEARRYFFLRVFLKGEFYTEHILCLLRLTGEEKAQFRDAAREHELLFAPDGILPGGTPLSEEDYARATIILGNPPPETVKHGSNLRFLQTRSAGTDQYADILPAGVLLKSASGAYGQSVSEHMFAMLLATMKNLPLYRDRQREGVWEDLGEDRTLQDATVVCLGTGDTGSSFCRLVKAMGAHTVGVRRDPSKGAAGVDEMHAMDELDALLPWADVIALFLPGSPDTAHLIDARRLLLMKKTAILLNAGRGSLVDCDALAETLAVGHLGAACLDVTEPEPLPPSHPLWREERAVITPHTAGGYHIAATRGKIAAVALGNLRSFLETMPRKGADS